MEKKERLTPEIQATIKDTLRRFRQALSWLGREGQNDDGIESSDVESEQVKKSVMLDKCNFSDDGEYECLNCGHPLDPSKHRDLEAGLSDSHPDYVLVLKCPACGRRCVGKRGAPKLRHKPTMKG